jgi:hypothetical protein
MTERLIRRRYSDKLGVTGGAERAAGRHVRCCAHRAGIETRSTHECIDYRYYRYYRHYRHYRRQSRPCAIGNRTRHTARSHAGGPTGDRSAAGASARTRHARSAATRESTTHAVSCNRARLPRRERQTHGVAPCTRSVDQSCRSEDTACQRDRGADEPLQKRRLEGGNVVLGRKMKQPRFDMRHAFADISHHLFELSETWLKG